MKGKYTREDIEAFKKEDPANLTVEQRRLANLKPTKPGEVRNPTGKTSIPWSTYFKRLMNNEEFLNTIISSLPKEWNDIVDKTPASVLAAGLIAVATRDVAKKVANGEQIDEKTLRLLDRIKDIGYGDKVTHEIEENGFFDHTKITFQVVQPDPRPEEE